jgi:zinc transporter ZupT
MGRYCDGVGGEINSTGTEMRSLSIVIMTCFVTSIHEVFGGVAFGSYARSIGATY